MADALVGLTDDGPEPDAFLHRDAVIGLFRDYAQRFAAPMQLGTEAARISRAEGHSRVVTSRGRFTAEYFRRVAPRAAAEGLELSAG